MKSKIQSLIERFFAKVDKTDNCWNWTGGSRGTGYGAIKYNGKSVDTHRVSWEIHFGKIPKGIYVCHTCDNRKCINPSHLFLGTQKDNMIDCSKKGRMFLSVGKRFEKGNIPVNRTISNPEKIQEIKDALKNRTTSIKNLSIELNLPCQLLRDISCGRVYK